MSKLKIAIQKSGRLSEKSLELLKDCGIKISTSGRKLRTESANFPIEVLFLRDDDIPQYVEQGVADIGILGENEAWEKIKQEETLEGRYKCWDCEKELPHIVLDQKIKEKCPLGIDGYRYILCEDCQEKEDY